MIWNKITDNYTFRTKNREDIQLEYPLSSFNFERTYILSFFLVFIIKSERPLFALPEVVFDVVIDGLLVG